MNVGFIGLGAMGLPMAKRVLSADHTMYTTFHRRREPAEELRAMGAIILATPAYVTSAADVVITILPADAELKEVVFGTAGIVGVMTIGMVVWGLASVIIGEALVGTRQLGLSITGAVMGSVLFRLLVAIALRLGLDPNDLKLVTAAFVFLALIAPGLLKRLKIRRPESARA